MNRYSIIKVYRKIKSPRIKLFGILCLHLFRRRYLCVVFDPILACNLRCRLCYFSNPEKRATMGSVFSEDDINAFANSLFHRCLKLQIGCGAEPTTYKNLASIVALAHSKGVPNISLITNGQLLNKEQLMLMADHGLNELTLSCHGFSKEVYEHMMHGARFECFTQLLAYIKDVKEKHPSLNVRINYTMCADNIADLQLLPKVFANTKPDIIQLRPAQDIGSTVYDKYNEDSIAIDYEKNIVPIVSFCKDNGITILYPEPRNLSITAEENNNKQHLNSAVDMLPYFNIAPYHNWKEKFNPHTESFEQYSRRTGRVSNILRLLFSFSPASNKEQEDATKALNYTIK